MVEKPKYLCYNIMTKNGCLGAKSRIEMCQTTILNGVAKAKRIAPTSYVEGEEIVCLV